jgi:hypothetical protein
LRYTGRTLAANRGFAGVAILTLALGIGANTANAVLLRRLPVASPEQLYRVNTSQMPWDSSNTGTSSTSFSDFVFEHLRNNHEVLSALLAYAPLGFNKISVRAGALPEEAAAERQFLQRAGSACGVAACFPARMNPDIRPSRW